MATGQNLLDLMEVLHPELQNQPTEGSVAKSLLALNMAQDFMESLFAKEPSLLGGTTGTIATVANTETTAFPAGVLRIDKIQRLDATTLRPICTLEPIYEVGGHLPDAPWPLSLATGSNGAPLAYYTNGTLIYWSPLPDAIYTMRWYGFQVAVTLAANGTFLYPDICMGPLATMAVRIIRVGLDDSTTDLKGLAGDLFKPAIEALAGFRRERARGFNYLYQHTT